LKKVGYKNTQLSFYSESSKTEFTSPVGDYFKDFPFENYDLKKINTRPEELSKLIEELYKYFQSHKPTFQFPSGVVSVPHEIRVDTTRIDQLKNGFIPICLWFLEPNIPNSRGSLTWDG
jgi:hypothetical protein